MTTFPHASVEDATLAWLGASGRPVAHRPEIASDIPASERADYGEVVLAQSSCDAIVRLSPTLPAESLDDAVRKLTRPEGGSFSSATARSMTYWRTT